MVAVNSYSNPVLARKIHIAKYNFFFIWSNEGDFIGIFVKTFHSEKVCYKINILFNFFFEYDRQETPQHNCDLRFLIQGEMNFL